METVIIGGNHVIYPLCNKLTVMLEAYSRAGGRNFTHANDTTLKLGMHW